jgi:hypothetical protein
MVPALLFGLLLNCHSKLCLHCLFLGMVLTVWHFSRVGCFLDLPLWLLLFPKLETSISWAFCIQLGPQYLLTLKPNIPLSWQLLVLHFVSWHSTATPSWWPGCWELAWSCTQGATAH